MSKKNIGLIAHFLKTSPISQYNQFKAILTVKQGDKMPEPLFIRDQDHVSEFLNRVEARGPSNANFSHYKRRPDVDHFQKILSSKTLIEKPSVSSAQEPQQLFESIRQVTQHSGEAIIPYQQLQQRLQIASGTIIGQARNKLIYLFKLLLNKREKIHKSSLEYEANYQLGSTIIASLKRAENDKSGQENWKQLEAMEQLLSAREQKRQGFKEIAMNGLESVCRNQAASAKTRLQALKTLCSSGEQLGDLSKLQSLVSDMRAKGEKQYEQIILTSIRRIKGLKD